MGSTVTGTIAERVCRWRSSGEKCSSNPTSGNRYMLSAVQLVANTTIGGNMLGSTWRTIVSSALSPAERDASTNSRSRIDRGDFSEKIERQFIEDRLPLGRISGLHGLFQQLARVVCPRLCVVTSSCHR
jgi:hypothetical protein